MTKRTVEPYDENWPQLFQQEAALIQNALGHTCRAIHHIGSTSVPGLCAKPVIDILCVVDNLAASLALQEIPYILKGEYNIPLRYCFSKHTETSEVNLHVAEKGHGFIALNLCFRDYLRTHSDARSTYGELKQKLINDPGAHTKIAGRFIGYTLGKDVFIKSILDHAEFQGFNLNFCMHDREWAAYHRIAQSDDVGPLSPAKNHFHFVFYKGTEILGMAHIEFLNEKAAILRTMIIENPDPAYRSHMLQLLCQWVESQGRVLKAS